MTTWLRRVIAWAGCAVPLFWLYMLLAAKWDVQELVAGGVCACLAASAMLLAGLSARVSLSIEPRWALRCLAAPWWIVRDSVLVSLSALRPTAPRGRFRTLDFPAGGDGPRDVGRRVMAKGPGSAGPNLYVIDASRDEDVLLVHELLPRGGRTPVEIVEP